MMKRKSRYWTMRAATHNPTPNEAAKASKTKAGKKATWAAGRKRYQPINRTKKTAEMRKSTKLVMTLLAGMTSRGKYTFEIKLELLTRLLPLSDNAVEKNCHGNM